MKKLLFIAAAATLVMSGCSKKQSTDVADSTPIDSVLINRLQHIASSGKVAFGHHDDPAYGYRWQYQPDSSDVKNITGQYPAVFDWDLGEIELRGDKQLDGVPLEFIRATVKSHNAAGGINTISWHPHNPANPAANAWVESGDTTHYIAQMLQPGAANDTLRAWTGLVADFIGSLKDDQGNRIPVVFRPWHEHTGSWFWWGANLSTPQEYKDLWKLTREIFDEKGIDNVVWAYSPDATGTPDEEAYLLRYPGDEYIDIVGTDVYDFTDNDDDSTFIKRARQQLDIVAKVAKDHGKVAAFTETGNETVRHPQWFTTRLLPAMEGYELAYVVVWRNAMPEMKSNHFYAPYKGHASEADFVKFFNDDRTIFLEGLSEF